MLDNDNPLRVVSDLKPFRMDEIAAGGYARRRRDDLNRALAEARAAESLKLAGLPRRKTRRFRLSGPGGPAARRLWRPLTATVAAAAAAAAAMIVVPAVFHPAAHPTAIPASAPAVTYQTSPATTKVTASYVLDKAAVALGSQAQVGTTWPACAYWHTEQESKDTSCPGQVEIANVWVESDGNGVGEDSYGRPTSSGPSCRGYTGVYEIHGLGESDFSIGQKTYTQAQLAALPTDPAKLWPIVKADERFPLSSTDPGAPMSGQSALFQSIWNLLTTEPVPTPLAKALYEVTARIPDVTVEGQYTDSLGRTGTLLHVGEWTMAIDTSNGQVLFSTDTITAPSTGTLHMNDGTLTTVYLSSGWAAASSVPKTSGGNGS